MLKFLKAEIVLGFLIAVPFWMAVLGWQASYSPTERQKEECYDTAKKTGYKQDECKTFWERTTSDPIATFNLILAFSTVGLWVATIFLYRAGEKQIEIAAKIAKAAEAQASAIIKSERPYIVCKITKPGLVFSPHALIIPDTDNNGRLHFDFVNAGRTPAMLEEFKEVYFVIEGRFDAPIPLDPIKDRGILLPVGTISTAATPFSQATYLFDEKKVPNIRKMLDSGAVNERRIFFQGFIRYSDAFGNHYITGFLAAYSPRHGAWALRGGKQYNYSRQEDTSDIPPHPEYPSEGA